jgi:uncharacterized protein (TIGR02145 family)
MRKKLLLQLLIIVSLSSFSQSSISHSGYEYKTVTSKTGKIWLDRNLGASQAATSSMDEDSYGDLYQWGRGADGHQFRNSATTSTLTLSSTDEPGHGDFIVITKADRLEWWQSDWRSPKNDNLWQGANGTNNPCPSGYRLPTIDEWEEEAATWVDDSADGAFASPLKLPKAGKREFRSGSLTTVGRNGNYWSSSVIDHAASRLWFDASYVARKGRWERARGYSVRCLKD